MEVEREYPELEKLVSDMFDTMYASEGVGLAAPQIGKSLRLFVVDTSPFGQYDPSAAGYKRVFVNPEITEESDEEVLMNEGCLSLPGLHEDVYRPEKIRIRYFDERFQEHEEVLEGWPARAVQHEYDHIEGVVFTMYDARTNLSLQVVENVKENLDQNIYKTIIPRNVRLAEAPSYGKPINLYDSRSTGAESYRLLAEEVISREGE